MTASIDIPEKYLEVHAGGNLHFDSKIKLDSNDTEKDLIMEYLIKDINQQKITYLKVLKTIDSQASLINSINIPENTKAGRYKIFLNVTDNKRSTQEVAASFKIANQEQDSINKHLLGGLITFSAIAVSDIIHLFFLIRKKM